MAKPLSIDLRQRILAAVNGGMSRRQAAERFGVSVASAIRWCGRERDTGDVAPKSIGGDRRSARIEANAPLIMAVVEETPDITLAELRERLVAEGHDFGVTTLWRFFKRRRVTLKKRPRMPRNKTVPTS